MRFGYADVICCVVACVETLRYFDTELVLKVEGRMFSVVNSFLLGIGVKLSEPRRLKSRGEAITWF